MLHAHEGLGTSVLLFFWLARGIHARASSLPEKRKRVDATHNQTRFIMVIYAAKFDNSKSVLIVIEKQKENTINLWIINPNKD